MPQRRHTAAVPILRAGVYEENLGLLAGGHSRAQPVAFAGHRVGGGFVANRKYRLRKGAEFVGLREPLVEAAEGSAAGLDEKRIDGRPALFVGGEAFVNYLALEASRLGSAVGVGVAAMHDGVGIVFHRRWQSAKHGES